MKNKIILYIFAIISIAWPINSFSNDDFNFQISKINIYDNGNLLTGSEGGKAITNEGIELIGKTLNITKLQIFLM